tara:strand:- start:1923 stop:2282 length:360 start_codon:yes stop_codon:yes gene_type:complete
MKKQQLIITAIALGVLAVELGFVSNHYLIFAFIAMTIYATVCTLTLFGVKITRVLVADFINYVFIALGVVLTVAVMANGNTPVDTVIAMAIGIGYISFWGIPAIYFIEKAHRKDSAIVI